VSNIEDKNLSCKSFNDNSRLENISKIEENNLSTSVISNLTQNKNKTNLIISEEKEVEPIKKSDQSQYKN